jgi:glucose-6-phosphate isomerase
MNPLEINYADTCQVTPEQLQSVEQQLKTEISHISNICDSEYQSPYAALYAPFDEDLISTILSTVKIKKSLNPTTLVVIGIGGSNLGTIAVLEAIRGKFYNNYYDIKVYFVDTVDTDYVHDIAEVVEQELATGNNILINVISKSGSTTETIANFELFLEILKSHRPYNYHAFVVATTDTDSPLWHLAQTEEFTCLAIPYHVGGRYSVFSAVGLFPLLFLGINIKDFCAGARAAFTTNTHTDITHNSAALSAAIIATQYQHGNIIHDTFIFSTALSACGAWYRQLSAESIGKAEDNNNKRVNIGLLPTISIGSTDLHSVAQLYLAGPHNRFTTFITVNKHHTNLRTPNYPEFESIVPHIQRRSLTAIMDAILQGTQKAYQRDKRPFMSVTLMDISAYTVGYFLYTKMIEIIYLGHLLNVNSFDQPQVELYKKETKQILAHQQETV